MQLQKEFRQARRTWSALTIYQRFEYVIILILTVLLAIVVAAAIWHLAVSVGVLVLAGVFDPTDQGGYQQIFGMILILVIALEFERSLLAVPTRQEGVIRLRTLVVVAMLATVRQFIIIDGSAAQAGELLALAAAILALGIVHWLVRNQDRRGNAAKTE